MMKYQKQMKLLNNQNKILKMVLKLFSNATQNYKLSNDDILMFSIGIRF